MHSTGFALTTCVIGRLAPGDVIASSLNRPLVLYPVSIVLGLFVWEAIARVVPKALFAPPSAVLGRLAAMTGRRVPADGAARLHPAHARGLPARGARGHSRRHRGRAQCRGRHRRRTDPQRALCDSAGRVGPVLRHLVRPVLRRARRAGVRDVLFRNPGQRAAGRAQHRPRFARRRALARNERARAVPQGGDPGRVAFHFHRTAGRHRPRGQRHDHGRALLRRGQSRARSSRTSSNAFDTASLFAVILVVSLFGLACQEGMRFAERLVIPWHHGSAA